MKIMLEQNNIDPQSSSFGWDGSHHSQTLNPGVYVWMAQYKDCNGNKERHQSEYPDSKIF